MDLNELPQLLKDWISALNRKIFDVDGTAPKDSVRVTRSGNVGLQVVSPRGRMHVKAGDAETPPVIINRGVHNTQTIDGAIENDGYCLSWVDVYGIRRSIVALPEACVPNATGLFQLLLPMIQASGGGSSTFHVEHNGSAIVSTDTIDFVDSPLNNVQFFVGAGASGQSTVSAFSQPIFVHDPVDDATIEIDWSQGNLQRIELAANATATFTNPLATGEKYLLEVTQVSGGSHLLVVTSADGTIKWRGGVAPTFTTTVNKTDIITAVWDTEDYYCDAVLNF